MTTNLLFNEEIIETFESENAAVIVAAGFIAERPDFNGIVAVENENIQAQFLNMGRGRSVYTVVRKDTGYQHSSGYTYSGKFLNLPYWPTF